MNTKLFRLMSLLAIFFCLNVVGHSSSTVLPCTIEFPKIVNDIPQVCMYQGGERFTCEVDQEGNRACYTLPVEKTCTSFSLVITSSLQYESEKNTVQYLKVNPNHPYKFYRMELMKAPRRRYRVPSEKNLPEPKDQWIVAQEELEENGRIPDDAIIVLLNADYVETIRADEGFELPTIVIKDDILAIAGSEKKLHDDAIELLLSSLDYNPLHASAKAYTKLDKQKILVAMTEI